jgi:hypothetical protein
VSAAPAEGGTPVKVAVADYIPVNGEFDLVVFTGQPDGSVEVPFSCFFGHGPYEARRLVIVDKTSGQAGAVAGVITSLPLKAGTRLTSMIHIRDCIINGASYRVYEGLTE